MTKTNTARLPRNFKSTSNPANERTFKSWVRGWRNSKRASVVSEAMASYAIDGALGALDSDNPFTLDN